MPNYRTFGALEEGYLRDHPEEMDEYLTILFDEYAQSGDTAALLRTVQIDNLRVSVHLLRSVTAGFPARGGYGTL